MESQNAPSVPDNSKPPKVDIGKIKEIARKYLNITTEDQCNIVKWVEYPSYLQVYKVHQSDEPLAKISVYLENTPHDAVESVAATMSWLKQKTSIPQPLCVTSLDDNDNILAYDWKIELERWALKPLMSEWQVMQFEVKETLIKSLAQCHAELLQPRNRFKSGTIGSIYHGLGTHGYFYHRLGRHQKPFSVGPFNWDPQPWEYYNDIRRGPFSRASDWLKARLDKIIAFANGDVFDPDDPTEEEMEVVNLTISVAQRLLAKIPEIFNPEIDEVKETVLWDPYIMLCNLFVDTEGKLAAIEKMQYAKLAPLWSRYQLPWFLFGPDREDEPVQDDYDVYKKGQLAIDDLQPQGSDYDFDYDSDSDPNADIHYDSQGNRLRALYWIHLEEYKFTKLRRVYLETMEFLHPGFQQLMKQYQLFTDFEVATMECQDGPEGTRAVKKWLDALDAGNPHYLVGNLKCYIYYSCMARMGR
ncbi:hypothetical protein PV04_08311 [Phialophora macrospora]|uniref:Aminoglycoside phosphotransferase domain-containing protein n=1 Tax=Phialophora macrospora TaxID=1851006 RepID=A0A0D2DVF5_9EURO|nr:hypothetical protein PV04_08311 [Phialophora macrospora]